MFRPCIDLHEGKVKQIVGGTLTSDTAQLRTNFVSDHPAEWFAQLYQRDGLRGGHVVMLGPGNSDAAASALAAYPGGLQVGGGIDATNALNWLRAGASHVIVTSWIFPGDTLDWERLRQLVQVTGRERLVLDLSCRRRGTDYLVVKNKFQTFTDLCVTPKTLGRLSPYCAEFLVHAVDVEGLCQGVDLELVGLLAEGSPLPVTYAGGARSLADLERVAAFSENRVDLTIGSALDIFGGTGVRYADVVAFNRRHARTV